MPIHEDTTQAPDGTITNEDVWDTDNGTLNGTPPTDPEHVQRLTQLQRQDKQQARAQRLTNAIDSLKGPLDLTPSEPLETGIVDPAVRRELRKLRTRQTELATATRAHRIILRDIIDEDA